MALMWLIHEWLLRLTRIRGQLESDAANGQEWLLRVRERILRFLVSRYGESGARKSDARAACEPEAREESGQMELPFPNFYVAPGSEKWLGGASAGPRKSKELREPLRDIRAINADKRARWRWWL